MPTMLRALTELNEINTTYDQCTGGKRRDRDLFLVMSENLSPIRTNTRMQQECRRNGQTILPPLLYCAHTQKYHERLLSI